MDIPVWVRRDPPAQSPCEQDSTAETETEEAPARDTGGADWTALEQQVSGCTLCALHAGRTRTVFGVGHRDADWMVIGEGPGREEDRQGEPFVGPAGKLLDAMLLAVGQPREQVYIGNIVKCRPPDNRDPKPEEAEACSSYLARQIQLVNPKIILAVGRVAAQNLLHTDTPVGRLRGRVHSMPGTGIPVIVTYHPAYLLRSPQQKIKVWQDLVMARRLVCGAKEADPA
jgi:DNA polymerase